MIGYNFKWINKLLFSVFPGHVLYMKEISKTLKQVGD